MKACRMGHVGKSALPHGLCGLEPGGGADRVGLPQPPSIWGLGQRGLPPATLPRETALQDGRWRARREAGSAVLTHTLGDKVLGLCTPWGSEEGLPRQWNSNSAVFHPRGWAQAHPRLCPRQKKCEFIISLEMGHPPPVLK